jgi:1,2-diacylglycerol 3-alpha-glucosyltransferase
MRIGMMADTYKPNISGVVNYISLNKRFLEKMGHEVFVFTFLEDGYHDEESNVIRSPGLPLFETGFFISLRYSSPARKLLQTMDVAHVQHPFISGTLARMYCRPLNIPIVFTNHTRYDLYTQAYLPPVADFIGLAVVKAYLPAFCRGCDLVISPSEGMRKVLIQFGVDVPINVVPNGVDLQPFQLTFDPVKRIDHGCSDSDIIFVYVGRLGPEKNLPFLLNAFSEALKIQKNLHLFLIGGGPEHLDLKETITHLAIQDHVQLIGSIPYEQLPSFLGMADVFITSSVTEVHPLTIIEAMAAGLPALGICSPGVGDLIVDGVTGLLIEKPDQSSFTAGIVRLAQDSQLRKMMGMNARQASENYAIENTAGMLEERYQMVISAAKDHHRSTPVG